jgi:lipase
VKLHVHEWGDADAPAVVCLHGVTGHGERFLRLATDRWTRFHVLAPDLRGHGRSGWEPPWDLATHVGDLVETFGELGCVDWVGHSFGGRLVLELAAREPALVRRAVLLDPAIQLLPHVAEFAADGERRDAVYENVDDYRNRRDATERPDFVAADAEQHCDVLPDGRLRRRTSQSAMVSIFGELAGAPPAPGTLRVPTLLIHAPAYGLVRDEQLEAYAQCEQLAVAGMHMVMWDAFDEVADAVQRFLEDPRAEC